MARGPSDIPWPEVWRGVNGPPPEIEVSRGSVSAGECSGDECLVGDLSDHALMARVDRMRTRCPPALCQRLPDKGAKLQSHLQKLEEELERRGLPFSLEGKDKKEHQRGTQSLNFVSSGSKSAQTTSSANFLLRSGNQSSFSFCYNRKLDAKTGIGSNTAFKEELRSLNQITNYLRRNEPKNSKVGLTEKMTSRSSSFKCLPSISKHNAKFPDVNRRTNLHTSNSYSKGYLLNDFSKRRVQPWDSAKIHDVVLLDDEDIEDVQIVQPIEEDGPIDKIPPTEVAKIYYPSRNHPECVDICYPDIRCLNPGEYLSSTIMNFYIQYLQKPVYPVSGRRGDYHFFNTYFYRKLEEAVLCTDKITSFSKLRRWLKGVNIFQKAYVFLPIHGNLHWSLIIICIPAMKEESGPIILHLDSLGLHDSKLIFRNIESYLEEEWKHTRSSYSFPDIPISESIWRNLPQNIGRKKIMVPQQKNEYDCGLFVLYFMERFIEEAPERARTQDLDMFGNKWFQPEEASGLRKRIRELLQEEFESVRLVGVTPTESPSSSGSSIECNEDDVQQFDKS